MLITRTCCGGSLTTIKLLRCCYYDKGLNNTLRRYFGSCRVFPTPCIYLSKSSTPGRLHLLNSTVYMCKSWKSSLPKVQHFASEDNHLYEIMVSDPRYSSTIIPRNPNSKKVVTSEVLDKINIINNTDNWVNTSTEHKIDKFVDLSCISAQYSLKLTDPCFMSMIQALIESLPSMNKKQLIDVISNVILWNNNSSVLNLLHSLDQQFLSKFENESNIDILFKSLSLWYLTSYGKRSDYYKMTVEKLSSSISVLNSKELVQFMFHASIIRLQHILKDINQLDSIINNVLDNLTGKEVSIICLAYFKTKTKSDLKASLGSRVLQLTQKDLHSLSDISIAAIMKFIRHNDDLAVGQTFANFLTEFHSQLNRMSIKCQVQACLTAARLFVYDPPFLNTVSENLIHYLKLEENVNVKYPEKFLFALSTFNHNPLNSSALYQCIMYYLLQVINKGLLDKFSYCVLSSAVYMIRLGCFPGPLIPFSTQFATQEYTAWAQRGYDKAVEILELDFTLEVLYPELYKNYGIDSTFRSSLLQKCFIPVVQFPTSKNSVSRRIAILQEVWQCMCRLYDPSGKCIQPVVVLPHFFTPDLILCQDKSTGQIRPIPDSFLRQTKYMLKRPVLENTLQWTVLVLLPSTLRQCNTKYTSAYVMSKIKQLEALNYQVITIEMTDILGKNFRNRLIVVKDIMKSYIPHPQRFEKIL